MDGRSRPHPRRPRAATDARRAGAGRRRHPRRGDRGHPGHRRGARPARRGRSRPRALRGRGAGRPRSGDPPGDEALPAEALGRDPGALGRPAPLRLVHARGDRAGRGGHGSHPGLPRVGGELLRPLPHGARGRAPGAGLHQHQLLAARSRSPARGLRRGRRRRRAGELGGRQGLRAGGSSASARATWRRWRQSTSATTARSPQDDAETAVEQLRKNRKEILPEKRLQDRPAAGGPKGGGDKRISRHPINKGTRPKSKAKKGKK